MDDNEINRDLLSRRLERQGHRVAAVEGGRQALERLAREPFDLVLLDIMMPEMNGFQVLERLKADPALRHVPVIMISALDELDSVVRCIEMGAEDYLPKPFNPVLLQGADRGLPGEEAAPRPGGGLPPADRGAEEAGRRAAPRHPAPRDRRGAEGHQRGQGAPLRTNVAVLFCDIVGFTTYSEKAEPEVVVANLQELVDA